MASSEQLLPGKALPFLAFGRVRDKAMLACAGERSEKSITTFVKLLETSQFKMTPGKRLRLQWGNGSVCLSLQGEILYSLVTASLEYPERLAFQLLNELTDCVQQTHREEVGQMQPLSEQEAVVTKMHHLLEQYENPDKADKVAAVYAKTQLVKSAADQAIRSVLRNSEPIQSLEIRSHEMDQAGQQFDRSTGALKRHFWFKSKVFIAVAAAGLALIVLCIILR